MAFVKAYHVVVTLTGSAQQLPASPNGGIRWLSMQPGVDNAGPVYVGDENVSSTDYGVRLPASVAGIPSPPHIIAEFEDGTVNLQDMWVLGVNGEKLHIHVFFRVHPI